MEDRIKIGDVWYVKEDQTLLLGKKEVEHEVMYSKEMQIDVNGTDFIVLASCLLSDKFTEPDMVSIDIKTQPGEKLLECMDNEGFILGVANREVHWLKELNRSDYDDKVLSAILLLCDKMKELKWV